MQKLVTIALYAKIDPYSQGEVEEHLDYLLSEGWKVISVTPVRSAAGGGDSPETYTAEYPAVLLEKR